MTISERSHAARSPAEPTDLRGTVDVINFWCVAVLLLSAVSVAAVVGAAVVTGEFDEIDAGSDVEANDTDVGVLLEEEADGTSVTWSDPGDAKHLEIRDGDDVVGTLDYVGDSTVVERERFEVIAVYEDDRRITVESHGM